MLAPFEFLLQLLETLLQNGLLAEYRRHHVIERLQAFRSTINDAQQMHWHV